MGPSPDQRREMTHHWHSPVVRQGAFLFLFTGRMLVKRARSVWLSLPCLMLVGVGGIIPDAGAGGQTLPDPLLPFFPPELLTWGAKRETGNLWTVFGTVKTDGQSPTYVAAWGLPSINLTISVNADGSFAQTFQLPDGVSGYLLIQAFDEELRESEIEDVGIFPAR
jgi:hypothetical protein